MPTVIKLKRGTTTPTTSNIVSGEIAVDTSAQKLYINDASTIKTIGLGNPSVSDISDLTATAAELNYTDGVTSNIQTQLNAKSPTASPTFTGILSVNGTQLALSGAGTDNRHIEIGVGRTGNGFSYIDLIGDTTYSDYGLRLIRGNGGANTSSELTHRGTGPLVLTAFDAGYIDLRTANTNRIRIDSSGKVGIGTSSPSVKLELNNGGAGSLVTFTDGVATNFNFSTSGSVGTFGTDAGSTSLALKTAGSERMRINSSGNVGIGDTTPSYKLDVAGDINYTGTLYNNGVASGSPAQVLIKNVSGTTIKIRVGLNAGGTTTNIKNSAGTTLKTAVGPFISGDATF